MSSRNSIRYRASASLASARAMRQALQRTARISSVRGPTRRATSTRSLRAAAGEKKGLDTSVNTGTPIITSTNTNGNAIVLNLIQQGAASWNRVGRKAIMRSLRVRGYAQFTQLGTAAGGTTQGNSMRIVVVWDKQPSGAAIPAFDNIFGITAQDGTESCPNIYCPPKYDNMDRFRVLKDVVVDQKVEGFIGQGTNPSTVQMQQVDCYIKLGLLETVFSGQSNPMTIADISTGALYIYFRAINNNAEATCIFVGTARLRYAD